MAVNQICDRCGRDMDKEKYQRGLVARVTPIWKFWGVVSQREGFLDMWQHNKYAIDLCQNCTTEFLIFSKSKRRRK